MVHNRLKPVDKQENGVLDGLSMTKRETAYAKEIVNQMTRGVIDKRIAAINAGYSVPTASSMGSQLYERGKIQDAIGRLINEVVLVEERNSLLLQMIEKYKQISRFDLTEVMDINTGKLRADIKGRDDLTRGQRLSLKSIGERRYGKDGDEICIEYKWADPASADKVLRELVRFSIAAEANAQTVTNNVQVNAGEGTLPVINISVGKS